MCHESLRTSPPLPAASQVTKRSFEAPADGSFGTSEYARVADAGSAGVLNAVPVIRATRVQVRYRWEPTASPAGVGVGRGGYKGLKIGLSASAVPSAAMALARRRQEERSERRVLSCRTQRGSLSSVLRSVCLVFCTRLPMTKGQVRTHPVLFLSLIHI